MIMKIRKYSTNILLSCMVALSAWGFTACDDTVGSDSTPSLELPTDTLFVDAVPGDKVPVTFSVSYNWKINSNADWCRVDGEYLYASGKEGTNTVEFVISNLGNLFQDNEALITLHSNGKSRVVACITRSASESYAVKVNSNNKEYAAGESIVIDESGKVELNLQANFNIDQLGYEFPEWIKIHRKGNNVTLNVVDESLKYVINEEDDSLRLFRGTSYSCCFHVQYVGMSQREVRLGSQLEKPLIVSRDAKRATIDNVKSEMPVAFTVAALNDKYQVVSLSYDKYSGYSLLADDDRWFEVADDNHGNIGLSVTEENTGKDRTVDVFVLPQFFADSLDAEGGEAMLGFFSEEVNGMVGLKEDAMKYHLAQVTQDGEYDITITPEAQWGLKVSVDGKTYTTPTSVGAGVSFDAPVTATIDTYRGYQLLHVSYDNEKGCFIMPTEESWLEITDDGEGNVEVYFSRNTGNQRTAYLLALPLALVENTKDLAAELFGQSEELDTERLEIKLETEQYIVAQFTQDADENTSLKVIDTSKGWDYLTVENETDEAWLSVASEKGLTPGKVFRADLESGSSFVLNPLLAESLWNPGDSERNDRIEVYGESGTKYVQDEHFVAEPTKMEEEEGKYMLIQFKAYYELEEEYYIIYFVTDDNTYLKALVVWNYW